MNNNDKNYVFFFDKNGFLWRECSSVYEKYYGSSKAFEDIWMKEVPKGKLKKATYLELTRFWSHED